MQNKTKIDGISSLIDDLKKVYEEARNGELKLTDAREIANVAGKLIKASSVKLDYYRYKNSGDEIDFLKT